MNAELFIRGAVTCGEFVFQENIFVGKAVDEVADWCESCDWIGVHMTPSAELYCSQQPGKPWVKYGLIPLKNGAWSEGLCVDWTSNWKNRASEIQKIKGTFLNMSPITQNISGKFKNTLIFIEKMGMKHGV